VTARRREESLQTVPLSISALSGQAIDERQVQNLESLSIAVPSMTIYAINRNDEAIIMRGQSGAGAAAQGQEAAITQYFAEAPLPPGGGGGPGRYFDLEDIQVLKGPQGTLFGRNSTGGAVLYEPRRPTDDVDGYARVQFGNYSDHELQAALNLPIVHGVLLVRVAMEGAQRDGYTTNVLNGQKLDGVNHWAGRLSLLYRPGDTFENSAVLDGLYAHTSGSSEILAGLNPAFLGPSVLSVNAQAAMLGIRQTASDVSAIDKSQSWGITDIARWTVTGDLTVKNIMSYRQFRQLLRVDNDGSPLPLIDLITPSGETSDDAQYTEELRLSGVSLAKRLTWTVGGFYLSARPGEPTETQTVTFFAPVTQTTAPTERSVAVYGQATYDLSDMVKGLRANAGYRYTWDDRSLVSTETRSGACAFFDLNGLPVCRISVSARFQAPTWDLGLDYTVAPGTLIYATARRGYRSGGLNTQVFKLNQVPYGPEYVKDVELGVKSDWRVRDVLGRTNLAIYRTDFTDIQASEGFSSVVNGSLRSTNLIGNFGAATINGVELDSTIVPTANLQVSAAWAYTDAKFDSFLLVSTGQQAVGRPFPFTPLNKLSLNGRYRIPIDPTIGKLSLEVSWMRSSHVHFSVFPNEAFEPQPSYSQTDLRLDWTGILRSRAGLALFVTNAFDARYRIGGIPVFNEAALSTYVWNPPRMFGVQLRYNLN